jgi:RNA polymerase sigma factor (sigma-70 family)
VLDERSFSLADRIAGFVCRRHGLRDHDVDEFRSFLRAHMAERGDRILSAHDGRSGLETYLSVVVTNLFRDWQRREWGTWRPSAQAARLGPVAVELERQLSEGRSFVEAAADLGTRFGERATPAELSSIHALLPARTRRVVRVEHVEPPSPVTAETSLEERERREIGARLEPLLRQALVALDPAERLVLHLVFRDGLSVRAAARGIGLEHKRVRRRLERVLSRLRDALTRGGIDRYAVLLLLEAPIDPAAGWFENLPRDNDASRPSIPRGAEP